ncbi:hypothetical protein HYX58_00820 [Candidatus Dependentiae bacterium]|nr:hypothetical protein [Candidatus Dependentiae bacterium]
MKKYGLAFMICSLSLEAMNMQKTMIGFAVGVQGTMNDDAEIKYREKRDDKDENNEAESIILKQANSSKEKLYSRMNRVQSRKKNLSAKL